MSCHFASVICGTKTRGALPCDVEGSRREVTLHSEATCTKVRVGDFDGPGCLQRWQLCSLSWCLNSGQHLCKLCWICTKQQAAQYICASCQQDIDCTTLLFVDLTEGKGPLLKQSAPSEQRRAFPIHADLFCHRPGLRVLQVTWHPGSSKASLNSKLSPWHVDRNALTHPDLFLITPVLSIVKQITPIAQPMRYSSVLMQAVTRTLLC